MTPKPDVSMSKLELWFWRILAMLASLVVLVALCTLIVHIAIDSAWPWYVRQWNKMSEMEQSAVIIAIAIYVAGIGIAKSIKSLRLAIPSEKLQKKDG